MSPAKEIWALLDNRPGNASQTLGVAEALGCGFKTKHVNFTKFIKLPRFLIGNTSLGITLESLNDLLISPSPDVVIATGRRLATVAAYIKSKNPGCFLAQVQWPGFPSGNFDLIATPIHDGIPVKENIFTTIGAPNRVTEEMLHHEAAIWQDKFPDMPSPKFALLIGGSTHSREFSVHHARTLAESSSRLVNKLHGSLFITTSRRTSKEAIECLEENLSCRHYIHKWEDSNAAKANPYYGFLGMADAIIATGDSISMCSEACTTGKPVYIYSDDGFVTEKYKQCHQIFYNEGLAKPLPDTGDQSLFTPKYKLNDSLAIATEIRRRWHRPESI